MLYLLLYLDAVLYHVVVGNRVVITDALSTQYGDIGDRAVSTKRRHGAVSNISACAPRDSVECPGKVAAPSMVADFACSSACPI